jgi:hypothetical protein
MDSMIPAKAYRPTHQGYPSFHAKVARAQELNELYFEAVARNRLTVADACARLRSCVLIGAELHPEDCNIVQTYIGNRTSQNRYGK